MVLTLLTRSCCRRLQGLRHAREPRGKHVRIKTPAGGARQMLEQLAGRHPWARLNRALRV